MLPAIWGLFIFCMVTTKGKIGAGHLSTTAKSHNNVSTQLMCETQMSDTFGQGWGWFFVYSINAG